MKLRPFRHIAAILTLLCAGAICDGREATAQVFDFGQIDAFESLGSGTQQGGAPAKTIVNDGERHSVLFTIFESNTDAKITWRSKDGEQTTTIRGTGVQAFQTIGKFKIEAAGDSSHSFRYGYVLLRLKSDKNAREDRI